MLKKLVGALLVGALLSGCGDDSEVVNQAPPRNTALFGYTLVASRADRISVFNFDTGRGLLQQVPGSPFAFNGVTPNEIVIHPAGRFVYVSGMSPQLLALNLDQNTGALSQIAGSPVALGFTAFGVAMDRSAQFLYTFGQNRVDAFSINPATGALTRLQGFPLTVAGATQLRQGVFDRTNRFLYVTDLDGNVRGFSVAANGGLTPLAGSPFNTGAANPFGIAVDSSGRYLYTAHLGGQLRGFRIADTGALSALPAGFPLAIGNSPDSLSVSNQELFVGDSANNQTRGFLVNEDGALTPVNGSPFGFGGVADPVPGLPFVVTADFDSNRVHVGRLDGNGGLTEAPGSPVAVPNMPFGVRTVVINRSTN